MSVRKTSVDPRWETASVRSEGLECFRAAGVSWTARAGIREEVETLFGGMGRPPELDRIPGSEIVKATPKRIVCRSSLGARRVYIKHYRLHDRRERAKYLFVRPRALAEWRAALQLREAGIDVLDPLAVGTSRCGPFPGDAWFIASELPGERLDSAIEAARVAKRDIDPLVRAAVELHERLLASGFVHPDLHAGNMLVRWEAAAPRIGLVDLHAIRRPSRPPSPSQAIRVRAKLAHSLWLVLDPREFERALEMLAPGETSRVRRSLETIERTRLHSRSKRCVRVSTSFARDRRAGWLVWRRRSVDLDSLLAVANADAGCRARSAPRLQFDGRLEPVEVLRFAPLESRSMRAWKGAHALAVRGIPGRAALAHMRRLRLGVPWESILVTERLQDAVRLDQIDPETGSEQLLKAALEAVELHHRFGISVRPEDLLALHSAGKWRVVRSNLEVSPRDRPLDVDRAAQELEAIRVSTAPRQGPQGALADSDPVPGGTSRFPPATEAEED